MKVYVIIELERHYDHFFMVHKVFDDIDKANNYIEQKKQEDPEIPLEIEEFVVE